MQFRVGAIPSEPAKCTVAWYGRGWFSSMYTTSVEEFRITQRVHSLTRESFDLIFYWNREMTIRNMQGDCE